MVPSSSMLVWVVCALVAALVLHLTSRITRLERRVEMLIDRMQDRPRMPIAPAPAAPPAPAERPQPSFVPPPIIPQETRPSPAAAPPPSLEAQIGSNWLLYIGVVAIVVGVAYFEKLAFDNNWIGPAMRVIQGAIAGAALVYGGWRFMRAGYRLYGQMIAGGGIAVLYVSTYAAFTLYHLTNRPVAFALMCGITAVAAWMADRRRAQGLALMAVGGGFATPFLLSSAADAQIALFTYDAVLIAGTMYLAHRRGWPWLNALSYWFTAVTVLAWAATFYTPAKYLRTELFLTLFCAMYLYILRENRRSAHPIARLVDVVLATAPFVYYVASLAILANHVIAFLVYLVIVTTIGCMVAARLPLGLKASGVVRLPLLVVVTVPLLAWISTHAARSWLTPGLVTILAIYVVHLIAHFESTTREGHELGRADITALHANALAAFLGAYWLVGAVDSRATAMVAALFTLWHGIIAAPLINWRRSQALHFLALAFTFLAVAVALRFNGVWITIGWAAEGAVLMGLGLHERRDWLRAGGLFVFALAVIKLLDLQFGEAAINQTVLLNRRAAAGAFVIALTYATAWVHAFAGRDRQEGQDRQDDALASRPSRPSSPSRPYTTEVAAALIAAQLLTLSLLTSEIRTFWSLRLAADAWPSGTADGRFVRELMLSITWAAYATGLIIVGIRKRYAPLRYTAFAVFAVTIIKVFGVDLATLDRIYRVSSIIGLGIMLLLTSYLYHRFRGKLDAST